MTGWLQKICGRPFERPSLGSCRLTRTLVILETFCISFLVIDMTVGQLLRAVVPLLAKIQYQVPHTWIESPPFCPLPISLKGSQTNTLSPRRLKK